MPSRLAKRVLPFLVLLLLCGSAGVVAQPEPKEKPIDKPIAYPGVPKLDDSRYPNRIPDWLWQDERRANAIGGIYQWSLKRQINSPILRDDPKSDRAIEITLDIAKQLGAAYCLRDFTVDSTVFKHPTQLSRLGVHIDPTFSEANRKVLIEATKLFLLLAFDDDVVETAWKSSIENPTPVPEKYRMKDDKPILDVFNNKVFTDDYKELLRSRSRPADVDAFKSHMRSVLCRPDGDPAFLAISRYSGNVWWGRGTMGFYDHPLTQLTRCSPAQSFLSIALNSDRMVPGETDWDSPAFWASKIAHECLHNLGYAHPNYDNPKHRDEHNQGNKQAFIVAYERAIFAKAKKPAK